MAEVAKLIDSNLLAVLSEVEAQPAVGECRPPDTLSFSDEIKLLHEWIDYAGEAGLAYESLVCMLESEPFQLSGSAAVKLLEVGLLMKFKTERLKDEKFRIR